MSGYVRVAAVSLNQKPLDWEGNRCRILACIEQAKKQQVQMLCLPELAISGYGCEDMFFHPDTIESSLFTLEQVMAASKGISIAVGLPILSNGYLFNAVAMVQNQQLLGLSAKRVLAREGVHYEPRWFKPWPKHTVKVFSWKDSQGKSHKTPLGDLLYSLGPLTLAMDICEEAWDRSPLVGQDAQHIDIVLNASASHFSFGKAARREQLIANQSRALQVCYVYSNLIGCEAGRIIYDGGSMIANRGSIVERGKRFGFKDFYLTTADVALELEASHKARSAPYHEGEFAGILPERLVAGEPLTQIGVPDKTKNPKIWQTDLNEEFLLAQALGLFDYLRKSKSKGFVISLSGGCDSSCVAILVSQMVHLAVAELGVEGFLKAVGLISLAKHTPIKSSKDIISRLLICIYQATEHSSEVTKKAARSLAQELNARFECVDVQSLVDGYRQLTEQVEQRPLSWEEDDLALQNIQARVRAPMAWMLANLHGFLLLATSNRSEAAVGYCTMDGDTAGGLAPIGGVSKAFLRSWLRYAETDCQLGLGPVAALNLVNKQQPTAELRPTGSMQTDERDLMPYVVMEALERYLARELLGFDDMLGALQRDFPSYDVKDLKGFLEKFLRLWRTSQWKRERLAPSFHMDDFSLDPKTFYRFPILT